MRGQFILPPRPGVRTRRGAATLEFAMCLPVLLALFVLIVWLGASLVGQTEVTVQARHKAWQQRFSAGEGEGNPLRFVADQPIAQSAETTVNISPIFAGHAPPTPQRAIFGASGGHRQGNLNNPPHWQLYTTVGGNSAGLSMQNLFSSLRNLANVVSGLGKILSGAIPIGNGGESLNSVQGLGGILPL